MTTSRQQLIRMLAMVPYLQSAIDVPVADLAKEFGVSVGHITRDLSLLMLTGIGELHGELIDIDTRALDERGIVRIRDAEFMPRPLRISSREGGALILALRTLRQAATGTQLQAIDGALAKLEGAMGNSEFKASLDVHMPDVDAEVKDTVLSARAHGKQLRLRYLNVARDEVTDRVVEPRRVFSDRGDLYLLAWCLQAGDVRTFRLDRIVEAIETSTPVAAHDDSEGLAEALFVVGEDTPFAILDLLPAGWWMIDYYHAEVLEELESGTLRVRLYGSDEAWLRRLIIRNARTTRVIAPERLVIDVADATSSALAAYDRH